MSRTLTAATNERLAILGGPKAVAADQPDLFTWPIVTSEDEQAVLEVLRSGKMSGWDLTMQFESEFARWQGTKFALAHCNGTAALLAAMFGVGVGRGDEVICPSMTYWASALPAVTLGASVVFADMDRQTLCIDPADIEHRITPRTKAIVVVHYCGHPADMDPIMAIANRHGLKVIEDASHAHGARYKGRMVGAIGHVAAMSMMAGKSFPIGEGGMLCTDDRTIYERAIALGHYERTGGAITLPELKPFVGMPLGGYKFRLNQTCAAMGRVQLARYDERIAEIQNAMNRFWDLLEGVPGLRPHRPKSSLPLGGGSGRGDSSGAEDGPAHKLSLPLGGGAGRGESNMGGWSNPLGHYVPEELGGLPVEKFIDAVKAEGGRCGRACNTPLHLHPVFNTAGARAEGILSAFLDAKTCATGGLSASANNRAGSLPATEALADRCFGIPWFKHDRPDAIARHAAAFAKVALQAERLIDQK